jgi:hypothetical protein
MAEPNMKTLVRVRGMVEGLEVEIEAMIEPKQTRALVERLREVAGLEPLPGLASGPQASGSGRAEGKPAELRQSPTYNADGDPCCPVHRKPLKEGRYGLYCSAKAEPPIGSEKGYCRYSWSADE